jgi:4-carboxymuconolactone decarboxylase
MTFATLISVARSSGWVENGQGMRRGWRRMKNSPRRGRPRPADHGGCNDQDERAQHSSHTQESPRTLFNAVEALDERRAPRGPLDEKTTQFIELAAAAAIRSEGAVHSHVRRALEAGAKPEEIRHAIVLVTSRIGYRNVTAALSWAEDLRAVPSAGNVRVREIERAAALADDGHPRKK